MKRVIKSFIGCFLLVIVVLVSQIQLGGKQKVNAAENTGKKNVVAYFPNWGTYNAAHNNMEVSKIPWDKVTVVNHAFFEVDSSNKLASTDTFADFDKSFAHSEGWDPGKLRGHFGEYKYYKTQYPNVKVIVSIGGWTRGNNFHQMASTPANRAVFINSVISFLKQYPFIDGIDIDWEYPGVDRKPDPNDSYDRGCPGGPEDKENYTALLREIREAYKSNGMSSKMLTVAIPSGYDKIAYQDPASYAQYVDFLNVMTYDMHGAWEGTTNHQSPLYANPNDPSGTSPVDIKNKYNTDSALKLLRDTYKVPAEKLNLGTPFYSRGWKGVTNNGGSLPGLFSKATGAAVGSWDNPQSPGGQYPYFQLKAMENNNGYTKYRDPVAKVPYLYNASQGIMLSYEDEQSLGEKCDYVINNNYGGVIAWEISGDDPNGYPMMTVLKNKLMNGNNTTQPTNPTNPGNPSGATDKPAVPSISCDKLENTGAYTITAGISSGNNATSWKLYENDIAIKNGTLTDSTPNSQSVKVDFSQKAAGTYTYKIDFTNKYGTSTSSVITVKVSSSSTTNPPGTTVKAWAANTAYKVGDIVSYNGLNYRCIQSHTSLLGWEPSNVPALWQAQ